MTRHDLTIATTGLNATDNPAPGVSVIRSIRAEPRFEGRLVGLAYDSLDPGLYARELELAGAFLVPYPSQGIEALRERLNYVDQRIPLDVIIPNLDSELPAFIALEDELRELGIGMYIPTRRQFDLRSKIHLAEFGERATLLVPKSRVVSSAQEIYELGDELAYPLAVKGVFYGATRADGPEAAVQAFHSTVARWGLPVILQEYLRGDEYDVVAVGDGRGGLVGAVPMKKTYVTDKGKGWAGVAVRDPELLRMTQLFMEHSQWRGPCEVEVLRTPEGQYFLLEVNPRFPAWVYLSAGAGQNLPYAVAQLAAGETLEPLPDFKAGTMFVRIALDQIATIEDFEHFASRGERILAVKEEHRP